MTKQVDLDALEALAKAATPGPWGLDSMGEDEPQINVWQRRFIATELPDASGVHHVIAESEDGHGPNAEHIAAFDPPTVLALIAELRQERERADEAEKAHAVAFDREAEMAVRLHNLATEHSKAGESWDRTRTRLEAEVLAFREQATNERSE